MKMVFGYIAVISALQALVGVATYSATGTVLIALVAAGIATAIVNVIAVLIGSAVLFYKKEEQLFRREAGWD